MVDTVNLVEAMPIKLLIVKFRAIRALFFYLIYGYQNDDTIFNPGTRKEEQDYFRNQGTNHRT